MLKEKFDFENEGKLSNTLSIFWQLRDKNKTYIDIRNIENIIPHAKAGLSNLFDLKSNDREEMYNFLDYQIKEVRRVLTEEEINLTQERLELLNTFQNVIASIFNKSVPQIPIIKLKINANKNVIYDLFKQLKKEVSIKSSKYVLSQTDEELAKFIVSYIEGFESVSPETVAKEISREQAITGKKLQIKVVE